MPKRKKELQKIVTINFIRICTPILRNLIVAVLCFNYFTLNIYILFSFLLFVFG